MDDQSVKLRINEFIQKNFVFNDRMAVGDDDSLIYSGVVDSTGVLELITFLESTFKLSVADDELTAENFDSVARITAFVKVKLGQS